MKLPEEEPAILIKIVDGGKSVVVYTNFDDNRQTLQILIEALRSTNIKLLETEGK
jgi:hypothetical protein